MVSNLFGDIARAKFIFRHQLATVEAMVACKAYPEKVLKTPLRWPKVLSGLWSSLPRIVRRAPLLENQTLISKLPQLVCWPKDGGAFVTLPQVHTEDVDSPGWRFSNIGMYRIQLSGNQYKTDEEVGLHYQLHRGIGVHHSKAINKNKPFRVAISVGARPALRWLLLCLYRKECLKSVLRALLAAGEWTWLNFQCPPRYSTHTTSC